MVTFTTKMAKKQKQMPTIEVLQALLRKAKSEKQKKKNAKKKKKKTGAKTKQSGNIAPLRKLAMLGALNQKAGF